MNLLSIQNQECLNEFLKIHFTIYLHVIIYKIFSNFSIWNPPYLVGSSYVSFRSGWLGFVKWGVHSPHREKSVGGQTDRERERKKNWGERTIQRQICCADAGSFLGTNKITKLQCWPSLLFSFGGGGFRRKLTLPRSKKFEFSQSKP
jgi:hypothetical protein